MTTNKKQNLENGLLMVTIALLALGVFMVFDASYVRAHDAGYTKGDSFFFLKRQVLWVALGIGAMFAGRKINYWTFRRYWIPFLVITAVLLVAVLKLGPELNGARRWIGFSWFRIQPSEMAKLAILLYLSHQFARRSFSKWSMEDKVATLGLVLAVAALIAKEPDLGTALCLAGTAGVMAFLGGVRKRILFAGVGLGAAGVALLTKLEPYRMGRILAWQDPWKHYDKYGFQVVHSLVALGSGGPLGRGPGQSIQKFYYLPACHTDFIYAIVGEELGLIGTVGLIGLLAVFCYFGLKIALQSKSAFGTLLGAGITTMICLQSVLNIAVVTAVVPATGVPLPFISFGGSSLVLTLFSVGVLMNISRNAEVVSGAEGHYESDPDGRRNRRAHLSGAQRRRSSIQSWRGRSQIRRNS